MNLKFDHTHYVPVLRFKRSEKVALRELGTQARTGITPLLEIVRTADYSPRTVADEIRTHWGPYPFFLDLNHLLEAEDGDLMLRMNGAIRSFGLPSIPVVGLSHGGRFQQAVSMVVALDKRGVCIRLFPEDIQRSSLQVAIERLVNNLGVRPEQVDLIADCRLISEFNQATKLSVADCRHLTGGGPSQL